MYAPSSLAVLADGSVAFSDGGPAVIRRIRRDGIIERMAGTGDPGSSGNGGPATRATIPPGADIAALDGGGLVLADGTKHRIRRVSTDGTITSVAGTGTNGFGGDGGPATRARLASPSSVSGLPDGGYLIADTGNRRIRRVDANGIITTVAGNGRHGSRGDGGPATAARLSEPDDVAAIPGGGFLIVDAQRGQTSTTERLRRVSASGQITTLLAVRERHIFAATALADGTVVVVVGGMPYAYRDGVFKPLVHDACPALAMTARIDIGDGGPARNAYVVAFDVAEAPTGGLFIADNGFSRIRRIDSAGRISTIAGGAGVARRLEVRDSPCGGASPDYDTGAWNYFGIIRTRVGPGVAMVQFGTTLDARVTLTARQGRKGVARRTLDVEAVDGQVIRIRVPAGRYRLELRGRHGRLRADDARSVRVP